MHLKRLTKRFGEATRRRATRASRRWCGQPSEGESGAGAEESGTRRRASVSCLRPPRPPSCPDAPSLAPPGTPTLRRASARIHQETPAPQLSLAIRWDLQGRLRAAGARKRLSPRRRRLASSAPPSPAPRAKTEGLGPRPPPAGQRLSRKRSGGSWRFPSGRARGGAAAAGERPARRGGGPRLFFPCGHSDSSVSSRWAFSAVLEETSQTPREPLPLSSGFPFPAPSLPPPARAPSLAPPHSPSAALPPAHPTPLPSSSPPSSGTPFPGLFLTLEGRGDDFLQAFLPSLECPL